MGTLQPAPAPSRVSRLLQWARSSVLAKIGAATAVVLATTGGLAVAGVRHEYDYSGATDFSTASFPPQTFVANETRLGWAAGGGANSPICESLAASQADPRHGPRDV